MKTGECYIGLYIRVVNTEDSRLDDKPYEFCDVGSFGVVVGKSLTTVSVYFGENYETINPLKVETLNKDLIAECSPKTLKRLVFETREEVKVIENSPEDYGGDKYKKGDVGIIRSFWHHPENPSAEVNFHGNVKKIPLKHLQHIKN